MEGKEKGRKQLKQTQSTVAYSTQNNNNTSNNNKPNNNNNNN